MKFKLWLKKIYHEKSAGAIVLKAISGRAEH